MKLWNKGFEPDKAIEEYTVGNDRVLDLRLAQYDITWGKSVYDGVALGAGLILGHVFNLSKRWNLELEGGLDANLYTQKEYYKGDTYEELGDRNNSRGLMMTPHVSVSISYIIR